MRLSGTAFAPWHTSLREISLQWPSSLHRIAQTDIPPCRAEPQDQEQSRLACYGCTGKTTAGFGFLNQFLPVKTEPEYLGSHMSEEERLRAVILRKYPDHMPEFEIALHTGMRPSEQYSMVWDQVDLSLKLVTIPKTKNGKARHLPLNSIAMAAFQTLQQRSLDGAG